MQTVSTLIETGTGVSQAPDSHQAGAGAANAALSGIRQFPPSVALVYASVNYSLQQVLAGIQTAVGDVPIVGTTTAGEICGGIYRHSVTVVVIASPYLSVHAAIGNRVSEDWQRALAQAVENPAISAYVEGEQHLISDLISGGKSLFAMIFYPGNTRAASSMGYEILETFKQISLGRIPVFGGASADDWHMESNSVFLGGQVHHDSILVAIFETQLEVGISLSHGFVPIGQSMIVTGAEGHELISLDQVPAAKVLAKGMGKNQEDLEGRHLTLTTGYPLGSHDPMGQYSVNIASYFTQRGGVRMTQPVSVGSELSLLVHDSDNSVLAGQEAVRKAMIRACTNTPALILVHYCALRPRIMGESLVQTEIDNLLEIAGTAPAAGFFSFGEDAVADDGISRHNNGAVAVLVLGEQFSATAKVAQENRRLQHMFAAQAEQRLLADVLRQMEEAIAVIDTEFRISYVNTAFTQLFGYGPEEVVGHIIDEIFPQDDFKAIGSMDISQITAEQSVYRGETYRSHKSGRLIPVRLSVSTLTDNEWKITGFVAAMTDLTSFIRASAEKQASEARYRAAFDTSPDSVNINRMSDGMYLVVNDTFLKVTGWTREEVIGRTSLEINIWHDPADRERLVDILKKNRECRDFEAQFVKKNGECVDGSMSASVLNLNGELCILSFTRDITDRKLAEVSLRESEARFRRILEHAPIGMAIAALDGRIVQANQALCTILGYEEAELQKLNIRNITHPDDLSPTLANINRMLDGEVDNYRMEKRFIRKNGQVVWAQLSSYMERDEHGKLLFNIGQIEDITERKAAEEQIRNLAFYDVLTQLPNRRLLNDRLGQMMAASKRSGRYCAFMFLDLDNFKPLNDTYGHGVGDLLLIEAAQRINRCVREVDTVARLGGDEFVVMLSELDVDKTESIKQADIVAEKIRASLAEPYLLSIQPEGEAETVVKHCCTSSIGVVVFCDHETSNEDLFKSADKAMYKAKEDGKNLIRFLDPQGSNDVHSFDQNTRVLRLNWHDSYDCGESSVDQDHRKLFDLANTLIESAFTRDENPQEFDMAMKNLLEHVVQHFADEEAVLARYQYSDLENHAHAHKILIEHALQLRDKAVTSSLSIGELLNFLAVEVVSQHMLKEDRKFYPLFQNAGISVS